MQKLIVFFSLVLLFSCTMSKNTPSPNTKTLPPNTKTLTADNTTYTGLIIEKNFVKKNGKVSAIKELYFRASIQDYYIKFCVSNVTKEMITPYIDKSITVDAEIINGNWDVCPGDPQEMQSRIGYYMVIKSIK